MQKLMAFAMAALAAVLLSGCPRPPSPEPPGAVNLRTIDEQELAAQIAKHQGQVVLVEFRATWCAPCVALMQHTVE